MSFYCRLFSYFLVRRKAEARSRWRDIAKRRKTAQGNTLGANFRKNFQKYQNFLRDSTSQNALEEEVRKEYIISVLTVNSCFRYPAGAMDSASD